VSELSSILILVFAGLILFLVILRAVVAVLRRKVHEDLKMRLAGRTVIRESIGANFFGLTSRGVGQVRGNGVLVLTRDKLFFQMFIPRREVEIPIDAITTVSTPRSHLGKSKGMRLLHVAFHSVGGEDAAAWVVADVDQWVADLKESQRH